MIGSSLEADIGPLKFGLLYIVSGFGGILFSAVCSDILSMGASTAVYGLIGSYLSFVILNWNYLKHDTDKRFSVLLFLFVSLFLASVTTSGQSGEKVDVLGHLGGFLTGAMLGLFLLPGLLRQQNQGTFNAPERKNHEYVAWIGRVILFVYLVSLMVCFYTLREPALLYSSK